MTSILALDQGTTGSTALVIHQDGRVLGRGYREIPQHYPEPGWVEHDPDDLFQATLAAGRDAAGASSVTATVEVADLTPERTWTPIGEATLKGVPDPVALVRLAPDPAAT